MSTRALLLLAALASTSTVAFADPMGDARGASQNPNFFDGNKARPDGDAVKYRSSGDKRTAAEVAAEEQKLADERAKAARANIKGPGADKEIVPPKPVEWNKKAHFFAGIKGALLGLLLGSLLGPLGLVIGAAAGGLIGYGMSYWAAIHADS